jgi:TonB family protein
MRLLTELQWQASGRELSKPQARPEQEKADVMPTLFGKGYGLYPVHRANFVASMALHAVAMVAILALGVVTVRQTRSLSEQVTITSLTDYVYHPGAKQAGGGGGGGAADKLNASRGELPRIDNKQLVPPAVEIPNNKPKLAVQATIVASPDLRIPQSNAGDPLSSLTAASNGTGVRSGIGSGSGGGVGSGAGFGYGSGSGGGFGGGVYRVGDGVTAPRIIYNPDPEYSDEARKTKHQGTVILWAIIGADGRPRNLRVSRSLGMGLDEKAIEAVRAWRFEPATKDGHPVAVMINVEVDFHLY